MGRNEALNKKMRDERREQILNAALKIFARKGLGSTKVSDIAAAAGVSHGLVYQYFNSKEEIFETLVTQGMELTKLAVAQASAAPGTPLEKIKAFFDMFIQSLEQDRKNGDHPYYFLIMIQAINFEMSTERVRKIIFEKPHPLGTFFFKMICEGQELGEISKEDPMMLTSVLLQLSLGMALCNNPGDNPIVMPGTEILMKILKH